MKNFRPYDRRQRLLLPPDLCEWVRDDDGAHFICEAVERVDLSALHVSRTGSGKAQYHPRMILALPICCHARGISSSRRIEAATHRDVSVRHVAAFAAAFGQVLLLTSESGLSKRGAVSVDGTKIDARAAKVKSVRYDRLRTLRKKRETDIADLIAQAEAADSAPEDDGSNLPAEIARRETLEARLDAAAARRETPSRHPALAARDDRETRDRPRKSPLQETQTIRRTRLRHPRIRPRLQDILPARHR